MDATTLARASEPFFTTKAVDKGTGLGLATARGFAEQSKGALHIESAPGRGTTVTLWLPVAAAAAGPERPGDHAPGGEAKPTGTRLLLVDDDAMVRESLATGLADMLALDGPPRSGPIFYAGDDSARELRRQALAGAHVVITDSNRRRVFVASRVRQTFGVDLPLQELFERPTIADLAAELDRRLGGSAASYGILLGLVGLGGVAAAMLLPRLRQRLGADRLVTLASLTHAGVIAAVAELHSVIAVAPMMMIAGFAQMTVMSSLNIAAQQVLP